MGLSGGKKEQERGPQKKEKKTEPAQGGMMEKLKASGQITVDKAPTRITPSKNFVSLPVRKGNSKDRPSRVAVFRRGVLHGEGSLNGKLQCAGQEASTIQKTLRGTAVAKLGKGAIKQSQIFDAIAVLTASRP